jgi:polyphosphate kinase
MSTARSSQPDIRITEYGEGERNGPARPDRPRSLASVKPTESAEQAAAAIQAIPAEQRYLNREVQWLRFNKRVLEMAQDPRNPLLERVKFLAIFHSNLDEYFMKRVGGLKRQVAASVMRRSNDGMTPGEQLDAIRRICIELLEQSADCFENDLLPSLAKHGVQVITIEQATDEERARLEQWFRRSVFPVLTPLAVDPGHRFPFISNLSISIGVMVSSPDRLDDPMFARVKVPNAIPRLVRTDEPGAGFAPPTADRPLRLVYLTDVIRTNLDDLFTGMVIQQVMPFRVTRNADIEHDAEDADDLLDSIESELKQRRFARAVRLELNAKPDPEFLEYLVEGLTLHPGDVYERRGPMDYSALFQIASLAIPELRFPSWTPVAPPRLADEDADIFSVIRRGDLLVHHPYDSFGASTERFIRAAARDKDTLAIKQTIYRTSADSPFVTELARAAENGKSVACLVEVRARFDEMNNVERAKELEKHGVHVAYGVMGLKTHTKISLVVRREPDAPGGMRCYAHVGTGNYNSRTAELYTDLGLLTCDPEITEDVIDLFNLLTGRSRKRDWKRLLIAPTIMRSRFVEMMDREIEIARSGGDGVIKAKMNQLEDSQIIDKLYEASRAGVQIDLIIRGFCCLRAGVPGMSENIRVMSSMGRFLEHSRIFHFGAGKLDPLEGEWYMGSADWMYRNLDHRVEATTPVLDTTARRKLNEIIDADLNDHRDAWEMQPDGSYVQRAPSGGEDPQSPSAIGSFAYLMQKTLHDAAKA